MSAQASVPAARPSRLRRRGRRGGTHRRRRPPHAGADLAHRRCAHGRRQLFFKAENLQRTGAFKFRGAYNAIAKLSDDAKQRGVVTFSSGNHAQAIAYAGSFRACRP